MGQELRGGKWYNQSKEVKEFVKNRDNNICQLCGSKENIIVDHKEPWAIDHNSTLDNLRALCRPCNYETRRPQYNSAPDYNTWITKIEEEVRNNKK